MTYQSSIAYTETLIRGYNGTWDGISAESVARMRIQNRSPDRARDCAVYCGDHAQGHGRV